MLFPITLMVEGPGSVFNKEGGRAWLLDPPGTNERNFLVGCFTAAWTCWVRFGTFYVVDSANSIVVTLKAGLGIYWLVARLQDLPSSNANYALDFLVFSLSLLSLYQRRLANSM